MSSYYEWESFADIYLEDSFVLSIDESKDEISFTIEVVLKENHPFYKNPKKQEQYCYKKGKIIFQNIKSIEWLQRNDKLFTDATGKVDYGNIDNFEMSEKGYNLSGDWGELKVSSSPVKLVWI
jgi:hypothetical protein